MPIVMTAISAEEWNEYLNGSNKVFVSDRPLERGTERVVFYACAPYDAVVGELELAFRAGVGVEFTEYSGAGLKNAPVTAGVLEKFGQNSRIYVYKVLRVLAYERRPTLSEYGLLDPPDGSLYFDLQA